MIKEYSVLVDADLAQLERDVYRLIADGWEPFGNFVVSVEDDIIWYYQPMVQRPPDTHSDVAALRKRVEELETALRYYAEAVVVANWGMQEYAPDWMVAREALGLPDLEGCDRMQALGE